MPKHLRQLLHVCLTLVFILSLVLVQPGLAAPLPQQGTPQPQSDDIRYGYNTETGRLSFVGGNLDKPLISSGEVGAQTVDAAAMSVIRRYAGQFGLQDPARNLRLQRTQQEGDGATLRYQQQYRGVPVVGGEMIINTDAAGNVLSLNGEVSPDLALSSVIPTISAEQARQAALQGMQEWHGIPLEEAESTEPELWIYDERLLKESNRPVALVWRMEVTSLDFSKAVHEFVLVDAHTGEIVLHFNQSYRSWAFEEEEPTPAPAPTEEPAPTPTESPTPLPAPTDIPTPEPTATELPAQEPEPQEIPEENSDGSWDGTIESTSSRYLSSNGNDSNDCTTPQTACRTFDRAYSQSTSNSTLYITGGSFNVPATYSITNANFEISGGWNQAFSSQDGATTLFGNSSYRGFNVQANSVKFSNLTLSSFLNAIWIHSPNTAWIENVIITKIPANSGVVNYGTLTMVSSAVSFASTGFYNSGTATVINSTFHNNLYGISNDGTAFIQHVTITKNQYYSILGYKTTILKNSIILESGGCSGSVSSGGYNIVDSCGGLQAAPTDWIGINARLGALIKNKYYPLLPGSPAIDFVPASCSDCPTYDIRGAARPAGGRYDAGAYEYVTPGTPVEIIPYQGDQQATGTNKTFPIEIAALVLDSIGSPVPGVTVSFETPTLGPSARFQSTGKNRASAITGDSGIAYPGPLTTNALRGHFTVSLSSSVGLSNTMYLYTIDLFVRPDGSNTDNDCQWSANPCQTLHYALTRALPGMNIFMSGGVYEIPSSLTIKVDDLDISGDWDQNFLNRNQTTVLDGSSSYSGRISFEVKKLTIRNITIRNFEYGLYGDSAAAVIVRNSAFINNTLGIAFSYPGSLTVINTTFHGNQTGLFTSSGLSLQIISSSFINNSNLGLRIMQTGVSNSVSMTSSIVAQNKTNCEFSLSSPYQSGGYNLVGTGCRAGENDQVLSDPKIGPLFRNRYHPLLPGSPAIDKIPESAASACPFMDVRGAARPVGERCDIGPYEYMLPGTPAGMYLHSGGIQTTGTNRIFKTPLQVGVYDSIGTPIPGIPVTFTAPENGASGIFLESGQRTATVFSDENGIAKVDLRSNAITGNFTVTASISGTSLTVPYSLSILNLYVNPSGSDTNNDCRNAGAPCKTLVRAQFVASEGAAILLTGGDHWITSNMLLSKRGLTVSGGWNESFTQQNGFSYLRGPGYRFETNQPNTTIERMVFLGMSGVVTASSVTFINSASVNNATGITNSGSLSLVNSTISGNRTGLSNSGTVTMINSTLAGNSGNAITQSNFSGSPAITMSNSIIDPSQACSISNGAFQSQGLNIISPDCARSVNKLSSDITGDAKISVLINLAYHVLLPGSPAIDAIDPAAGAYCPTTDQRGVARPIGARCDIGAYEYTKPGTAASLFLRSGGQQIVGLLQEPLVPLQVQVTDAVGAPVAGVNVTFTTPSSGASGSFTSSLSRTVQTDANGIAAAKGFRANNISGSYFVQASSPGLSTLMIALNNSSGLYVNPNTGNDSSNNCRSSAAPCKSIPAAVNSASDGDTIFIAQGTYVTNEFTISKSLYLSGGWNTSFTAQNGYTLSQPSSTGHFKIHSAASISMDRIDFVSGKDIISNNGTMRITNSSFRRSCGAIYNTGTLFLENVSIYNNVCPNPANLNIWQPPAAITNASNGVLRLTNVTIANNVSMYSNWRSHYRFFAAGIDNMLGSVFVKNSILTGNRSNRGFECSGLIISLGNNIVSIADGCQWLPAEGDLIGTLRTSVDAGMLEIPLDESGPYVRPLLSGSPAIDAADAFECPTHDQRGQARPSGAGCDIGAYEGAVNGVPGAFVLVYDDGKSKDPPGRIKCSTPTASCTNGSDLDADMAYDYATGFFKFLYEQHGRNGYDGSGSPLILTINYSYDFRNAFWTDQGNQVVFGRGYPRADDVVAHEITHGFTRTTSNLFYYYQSGAINESMSDLWGEYYDQSNGIGKDGDSFKWLIGEDLQFGAIRSMKNPPQYNQPDKMTSTHYSKGPGNNGGVHINNGVNNKAVYLMVDGGTFNSRTVQAIGWKKTSTIYYYAQTRLLTSASDYKDLYHAVNQACAALVGGETGITASDCVQVLNALHAVEMHKSPSASFNPKAPYCPTGMTRFPTNLYFEDFEKGLTNWEFAALVGNNRWGLLPGKYSSEYATSGLYALYGDDYESSSSSRTSDTYAAMKNGIYIPEGSPVMLHFNHAFGFVWATSYSGATYSMDGGVIEYTVNDGQTWKDAGPLFSDGKKYGEKLYNQSWYENPIRGRSAFVRDSRGYVSSRYNLRSLAGQTVRFRWRMGTGYVTDWYNFGWAIDDVVMYKCIGNPGIPSLVRPSNGSLTTDYRPRLDWSDDANGFRYELVLARDSGFMDIFFTSANITASEYTFTSDLPYNTRFFWRVRSINEIDKAGTWSATRSFRTALLPTGNITPASDSVTDSLRPTFTWNASPEASGYNLVISTYSNFSYPLVSTTVSGNSYTPTKNLPANRKIYWRVRAAGANPSEWSRVSFTTPRPAPAPTLTDPTGNKRIYTYTPTLRWRASVPPLGSPPLAYYHLQISNTGTFDEMHLLFDERLNCTDSGCPTSFEIPAPLAHNQRFFWRVRAVNTSDQFAWWSSASFRTTLFSPELLQPETDTTTDSLRPTFQWSSSPDATSYTLVISRYANFSSPLVNTTVNGTRYTPTKNLPANRRIYWRVRANGDNPSAWSSSGSFTAPNPLPAPVLVAPVNASRINTYAPELIWRPNTASTFAYYDLQVSDRPDFSPPHLYEEMNYLTSSFQIPADLKPDARYYWRVRTVNTAGEYAWWSSAFFTIPIPTPISSSPESGETITETKPIFDWTDVEGAQSYTIVISLYSDFSSPLVNTKVTESEYTAARVLPRARTIYWRVRANGVTGAGAWTPRRSFRIQ
jgi:Zn-dependent metalloprotease